MKGIYSEVELVFGLTESVLPSARLFLFLMATAADAKQANRYGVLGYKGARRKRLLAEKRV